MTSLRSTLPIGFIAASVFCGSLAIAATTSPSLVNRVSPVHPPALLEKGVDGTAMVSFSIDDKGVVGDVTVVTATHPEFGDAAAEAVKQWSFKPAVRDGVPVTIKVKQEIKFTVPVEMKLAALAGRPVFVEVEGNVVEEKNLGSKPRAIDAIKPVYPQSLAGSGKTGKATVKFVITTEGLPVNPEIVSSEGGSPFEMAALTSVVRARWEPVSHEGALVNVAMEVPLSFKEGAAPGSGG